MASKNGATQQIHDLLYQSLETETGGIEIYQTAISCAINKDLKKEWSEYLEETKKHRKVMLGVMDELKLDPEAKMPGREVVAHLGKSLVDAMKMAKKAGDPAAAELVAAECVVLAETKDHQNWELIGLVAAKSTGEMARVLKKAYEAVEDDEDHHLYHTKGWSRELWIDSLGFPAVLPPPEEVKNVETAIGASRAEQAREDMVKVRN